MINIVSSYMVLREFVWQGDGVGGVVGVIKDIFMTNPTYSIIYFL